MSYQQCYQLCKNGFEFTERDLHLQQMGIKANKVY